MWTAYISRVRCPPMLGDPILTLVFGILRVPAVAFFVRALLSQFKFRAIWCTVVGEGAIMVFLDFDAIRPGYPHATQWLTLGIPLLFLPVFAGYFFNKHIVQGD